MPLTVRVGEARHRLERLGDLLLFHRVGHGRRHGAQAAGGAARRGELQSASQRQRLHVHSQNQEKVTGVHFDEDVRSVQILCRSSEAHAKVRLSTGWMQAVC